MTSEIRTKINKLLKIWPRGTVAVSPWLEGKGAYQQLVHEYEKSGWLERIGQGAFIQADDNVEWPGGLYAIQNQLKLPIHVGGKTVLQLLGYAHFLPLGKGQIVTLFGTPGAKLPHWFKQYDWDVRVQFKTTTLFGGDFASFALSEKNIGNFSIRSSSPERAIMEVLYLVPKSESFEESFLLMEGLTTLRPKQVQELLEKCQSVKVKRLFMLLAEKVGHAWVKKLDLSRVEFGKGNRMLIKGCKVHKKYRISVPDLDSGVQGGERP